MSAPPEAAQRDLYKRQWQVCGFSWIIIISVIIGIMIRNDLIFAAGMAIAVLVPLLIKCPRCGKSIMLSYGAVWPRETCPHCEWPKPE